MDNKVNFCIKKFFDKDELWCYVLVITYGRVFYKIKLVDEYCITDDNKNENRIFVHTGHFLTFPYYKLNDNINLDYWGNNIKWKDNYKDVICYHITNKNSYKNDSGFIRLKYNLDTTFSLIWYPENFNEDFDDEFDNNCSFTDYGTGVEININDSERKDLNNVLIEFCKENNIICDLIVNNTTNKEYLKKWYLRKKQKNILETEQNETEIDCSNIEIYI